MNEIEVRYLARCSANLLVRYSVLYRSSDTYDEEDLGEVHYLSQQIADIRDKIECEPIHTRQLFALLRNAHYNRLTEPRLGGVILWPTAG